jgi:hypothetical protein
MRMMIRSSIFTIAWPAGSPAPLSARMPLCSMLR